MNSSTAPRYSQSKRDTMNRLLESARREFAEKGLPGARVDVIAQAAGVTKQLVYHYFGSKEHLFACVLDESAGQVMTELVSLDFEHLAPSEALRAFLNCAFDQYRLDPALGSLAQEGIRYHDRPAAPRNKFPDMAPAMAAKLERILQRGSERGDFQHGMDARLLAAVASLVTTGAFTNRYQLSALAGFDTTSPEGMAMWRQYSADFVLSAISLGDRPALSRPKAEPALAAPNQDSRSEP